MDLPLIPWTLSETAGGIIAAAAVLAAIGSTWQRFLGPFLARPIGKAIGRAIRLELKELVEEVITESLVERQLTLIRNDLEDLSEQVTFHNRLPHFKGET